MSDEKEELFWSELIDKIVDVTFEDDYPVDGKYRFLKIIPSHDWIKLQSVDNSNTYFVSLQSVRSFMV